MDSTTTTVENIQAPIDCACLIHGNAYSWTYVERLYNMLNRHISAGVRLHVYTEAERSVPAHMIKHSLIPWGIAGPKLGWWYKMQLFNPEHYSGPLLYFDLDTVIVDNIDWIWQLSWRYFWTVRDFKYLWRPNNYSVNSSIMWWDTAKHSNIWYDFQQQNIKTVIKQYRGDQDYINQAVNTKDLRFLDSDRVKSWRWECQSSPTSFSKKKQNLDKFETKIPTNTSVLIFHGQPKPDKIQDGIVDKHWR